MIDIKSSCYVFYRTSKFRILSAGTAISICVLLGACGTYLPSSGPSSSRIEKNPEDAYELIPITADVVNTLHRSQKPNAFNSLDAFGSSAGHSSATTSGLNFRVSLLGVHRLPAAKPQLIAAGDVINVTIYETGGGLFGTTAVQPGSTNSSNQLPAQMVDESGEITVPYAGRIPVKGRAPHDVEMDIVEKLKGKAINPQVIVAIGERKGGNLATVTGDVKGPGVVPLGPAGVRLLDALTISGGSIGRSHETMVSVIRKSTIRSNLLSEITSQPSKNVALQAGDTVVVKTQPRTFLTFGATGKNARIPFDSDRVSLAEAIANSGGPLENKSNPSAIYLYRIQPERLVRKMGYTAKNTSRGLSPVIYRLNMVEPDGLFLAQNFEVQDKDIIYVASAGSVGLLKFLGLLNAASSGIRAEAATVNAVAQ